MNWKKFRNGLRQTKFTLFHKPRDKDNLPLQLPNLKIIMK